MKNTPEVRSAFDQMVALAHHLNNGYQIEIRYFPGGEHIALRIRKPADTEWAVYPEVDFYDDWYGTGMVSFGIATTGYGDHSLRQAQRVTTGLLAATNLVQNLYAIAEVAGLAVRQ